MCLQSFFFGRTHKSWPCSLRISSMIRKKCRLSILGDNWVGGCHFGASSLLEFFGTGERNRLKNSFWWSMGKKFSSLQVCKQWTCRLSWRRRRPKAYMANFTTEWIPPPKVRRLQVNQPGKFRYWSGDRRSIASSTLCCTQASLFISFFSLSVEEILSHGSALRVGAKASKATLSQSKAAFTETSFKSDVSVRPSVCVCSFSLASRRSHLICTAWHADTVLVWSGGEKLRGRQPETECVCVCVCVCVCGCVRGGQRRDLSGGWKVASVLIITWSSLCSQLPTTTTYALSPWLSVGRSVHPAAEGKRRARN